MGGSFGPAIGTKWFQFFVFWSASFRPFLPCALGPRFLVSKFKANGDPASRPSVASGFWPFCWSVGLWGPIKVRQNGLEYQWKGNGSRTPHHRTHVINDTSWRHCFREILVMPMETLGPEVIWFVDGFGCSSYLVLPTCRPPRWAKFGKLIERYWKDLWQIYP